ncbi:MAG TPA: AI-2E family transporter [Vicinamibacteria bacterium]|nr:AI-2E family transporter [Vicinamibacteria bacterium]
MTQPRRRSSDRYRVFLPLAAFLAVVALLAFLVFRYFLAVFTVAASVALLLAPVHRRLRRALHGRGNLSAVLLVFVTTLVILLPVVTSMLLLSQQAVQFIEWLRPRLEPQALQQLWSETLPQRLPFLQGYLRFDEQEASKAASAVLERLAGGAQRVLQGGLAGATEALFELVLFLMMLFFLLRDGERLRAELAAISPLSSSQEDMIVANVSRTVRGVLQALVLVPVVQGLVAAVGFILFGVPSPILWSVTVMLAAFVPIVGSPLGWLPAVAWLFVYGSGWQWAGLLAYGTVLISGIDNVVKPLVLQGVARIHPLLAFLSILGGLFAFGPLGFLIGPVVLSLVLSAIRIYRDVMRTLAPAPLAPPSVAPPGAA